MTITGGCRCGAVRYRIEAERITARHCWCRPIGWNTHTFLNDARPIWLQRFGGNCAPSLREFRTTSKAAALPSGIISLGMELLPVSSR